MFPSTKRGIQFLFFLIPIIIVIVDLSFRYGTLRQFSAEDIFFYCLSFVYETHLLLLLMLLLRRYTIFPTLVLGLYLCVITASYAFYSYFRTLPGINTFSFIYSSPQNSISILQLGINYFYFTLLVLFIVGAIIGFIKLKTYAPEMNRKWAIGSVCFFIVLSLVLNNNLKLKDNRTLPFTNTIFAAEQGFFDFKHCCKIVQIGSRTFAITGKPLHKSTDFNVLVIMNESLSPYYFKEYGGTYNTDSLLYERIKKQTQNFFIFNRAYTNSTVTAISVPFTLAGLNPAQGKNELVQMPLMYDYLKHDYTNVSTSFITSWSYDDYPNFKSFFNSENLDTYIYREKIKAPKVVDMGCDDTIITKRFETYLQAKSQASRFFSILHYSNTHYPHYSPATLKQYTMKNELLSDYLNSLKYFDQNIESVFKLLEDKGELARTIIVFTSDHSESLGEHFSERGHFGKYNTWKIKIPMWIYIPEQLQSQVNLSHLKENLRKPVCNNDIMPTLMELYKLPVHPKMNLGRSLLSPVEPGREILIYNGPGENRTDSKEYFGVLADTSVFIATQNGGNLSCELFGVSDLYQKTNILERTPERKEHYLTLMQRLNIFR